MLKAPEAFHPNKHECVYTHTHTPHLAALHQKQNQMNFNSCSRTIPALTATTHSCNQWVRFGSVSIEREPCMPGGINHRGVADCLWQKPMTGPLERKRCGKQMSFLCRKWMSKTQLTGSLLARWRIQFTGSTALLCVTHAPVRAGKPWCSCLEDRATWKSSQMESSLKRPHKTSLQSNLTTECSFPGERTKCSAVSDELAGNTKIHLFFHSRTKRSMGILFKCGYGSSWLLPSSAKIHQYKAPSSFCWL